MAMEEGRSCIAKMSLRLDWCFVLQVALKVSGIH
jgi:hypothetical protein